MPKPELHRRIDPRAFYGRSESSPHVLDVIRVDVVEDDGPDHLFIVIAQYPLGCRALVVDGALGVEDRNDV